MLALAELVAEGDVGLDLGVIRARFGLEVRQPLAGAAERGNVWGIVGLEVNVREVGPKASYCRRYYLVKK